MERRETYILRSTFLETLDTGELHLSLQRVSTGEFLVFRTPQEMADFLDAWKKDQAEASKDQAEASQKSE